MKDLQKREQLRGMGIDPKLLTAEQITKFFSKLASSATAEARKYDPVKKTTKTPRRRFISTTCKCCKGNIISSEVLAIEHKLGKVPAENSTPIEKSINACKGCISAAKKLDKSTMITLLMKSAYTRQAIRVELKASGRRMIA